ncbi:LysR family transcriptional regulator [Kerstersia gyiorum]|uniref:LysR family transcriptional regulator n=1 Tax=Kerstersia gyiorum TaxID=206506 RepID=UPI0039EC8FBF
MIDPLTLDQIRTFVAVADCGGFRAAAQKLARVQSAVSTSIANLEAQLGVQLFDRSGHRPVLTQEGQALLADAQDLLLRVDTMRARARGFGAGLEHELALVVDTLFPLDVVGVALRAVHARYPTVALRVAVEPLGYPAQALIERRCNLAIMVGEDFREPRISLEALAPVAQVAVTAADHPLAMVETGRLLGLAELAEHMQIVLEDPTLLSAGRTFGVLSPRTCRVTTQEAKHALIRAGVGWGRLPLWLVEPELQEGKLVRIRTDALGRQGEGVLESYLARRLDQPNGPIARFLADTLLSLVRQDNV